MLHYEDTFTYRGGNVAKNISLHFRMRGRVSYCNMQKTIMFQIHIFLVLKISVLFLYTETYIISALHNSNWMSISLHYNPFKWNNSIMMQHVSSRYIILFIKITTHVITNYCLSILFSEFWNICYFYNFYVT